MFDKITDFIKSTQGTLGQLPIEEIAKAIQILIATYERDGRIYVFGNGGSLALATHWVSDFNKTVFSHHLEENSRRFQAIRLPTTEEEITAWANDVGFDMIFAGPLKNYLRESDTVVAISSSGNSPNVIKAVQLARQHLVPVIGLSGFDGGELNRLSNAKIHVPTAPGEYELVEGIHAVILHLIIKYLKTYFNHEFDSSKKEKEVFKIINTSNSPDLIPKPALFLDRDGVINKCPPPHQYVTSKKEFYMNPQITRLVSAANKRGYLVLVVSNQRGISRGLMTTKDLGAITNHMFIKLSQKGAVIDAVYYCTHSSESNCLCRKPAPGLFLEAIKDFNIDPSQSVLIGDSDSDIKAAKSAGINNAILIPTNDLSGLSIKKVFKKQ